jgi:hypothetical protein
MEFRKDINGLRAIAVAAVVLYHFGIALFTGGFVGVDIFCNLGLPVYFDYMPGDSERCFLPARIPYAARTSHLPSDRSADAGMRRMGWIFLSSR